jgi:hypothetical protein
VDIGIDMKFATSSKRIALFAVSLAVGTVGGGIAYSAIGYDSPSAENSRGLTLADLKPESDLPPQKVLENGKTVGLWRLDTPIEDRPDFVESQLADGTPGYIKRTDIDDGFVLSPEAARGEVTFQTPSEVREQERRADGPVKPNSKGEVWVSLYDEDGKTVLGSVLISSDTGQ